MIEVQDAEEFYDLYLKTLNPYEIHCNDFEIKRLHLLINKKLNMEGSDNNLYLLKIYLTIEYGNQELDSYEIRLLRKLDEEGNGLSSYILYSCYMRNIPPFYYDKDMIIKYLKRSIEHDFTFAYEEYANKIILDNELGISKEEIDIFINKNKNVNLKEIYQLYQKIMSIHYDLKTNAIKRLEEYSLNGSSISSLILAKLYDEGLYVKKDIDKAIQYYELCLKYKNYSCIGRLLKIIASKELTHTNILKILNLLDMQYIEIKDVDYFLDLVSIKIKKEILSKDLINKIIIKLSQIDLDKASILLGQIYLNYPYLNKEKTGVYLLNYYANFNPNLYYDLYLYYSKKNNRKEAIRSLRRGIVKKDEDCINEAKGYKKLQNL